MFALLKKIDKSHLRHGVKVALMFAVVLVFAGFIGFELFAKVTESAVAVDMLSRISIGD